MRALDWLRSRDAGLSALRRATRIAIIMPSLFAIGSKALDNAELATFAAFGSFAMLLFVDFGASMRDRVLAQASLVVVGGVFVCLGTLVSRNEWLGAVTMTVLGFVVLFTGVVSSVLASATTSLLLGFILPVTQPGSPSTIGDRLGGWLLAGAVSIVAITVLWPAPARDPLRDRAADAAAAMAARMRAEVAYAIGQRERADDEALATATDAAKDAVGRLRTGFFATPYRPTGLTSSARTVVRLVDEIVWLNTVLDHMTSTRAGVPAHSSICEVKSSAAATLDSGARLLRAPECDLAELHSDLERLRDALVAMEREVTVALPVRVTVATAEGEPVTEFVSSLEPSFRAQEMSFGITAIAANVELTAEALRRTPWQRLSGQQPGDLAGPLVAARQRAGAHIQRHSVWLHNSLRGAIALGIAIFIAQRTGAQHSFWIALGILSVLRSNALSTGQNAMRAVGGNIAGFVIGGLLVAGIGTDGTVLWILLPIAVLLAGLAPAVISFAAGQAGFTITLLILFNIIAPVGWRVGLVRIEDVAIGCAVSLAVGLMFWPRGAGSALGQALADAYADSAAYLRSTVRFGVLRCDAVAIAAPEPSFEAQRAAASARRLDDAFRSFLSERGVKNVRLPDVTTLITGVAGLRLASAAVIDLWQRENGPSDGDRTAARNELLAASEAVAQWYEAMARALAGRGQMPEPLVHDQLADARLIDAVRHDLQAVDGQASATAVRMIWTGDHLDAARRLQTIVVEPARAVAAVQRRHPWFGLITLRPQAQAAAQPG